MKYHSFVTEYLNGQGSTEDRQAFEHELAENPTLASEYEASQLVEDILSFAAAPAVSAQTDTSSKTKVWLTVPRVAIMAIFLGSLVGLFVLSEEENTPASQIVELPVMEWPSVHPEPADFSNTESPAASISEFPKTSESTGKVLDTIKLVQTPKVKAQIAAPPSAPEEAKPSVQERASAQQTEQIEEIGEKLHIVTVDAVISEELPSYADVSVTATRSITLKPGFSAGHGSAFKAAIHANPFGNQQGIE